MDNMHRLQKQSGHLLSLIFDKSYTTMKCLHSKTGVVVVSNKTGTRQTCMGHASWCLINLFIGDTARTWQGQDN